MRDKSARKKAKPGVGNYAGVLKSMTVKKLGSRRKALRKTRERLVGEDVTARKGMMVDDVSTPKLPGIKSKAGGSTTKTREVRDTNGRNALSPGAEAGVSSTKVGHVGEDRNIHGMV